ncbi:MAG: PASTA domain-containing protein, partial [Methanosarcinaceae archaeon]
HQSPKAGCIANPLIPVDLVVSRERPRLKPPIIQRPGALKSPQKAVREVPRVIGVSFEEAVGILNEDGSRVGKISEIFSRISAGTVLHQGPKAGCIANSLVPVDLVVSRGRPKLKPPIIQRPGFLKSRKEDSITVPPVLGLPSEEAVEVLKQEGIKVGNISTIISRASPGRVLHQSLKAGCIANPLIPVDLVVSGERPKLKPPIIQRPGALNCPKTNVMKIPLVIGVSFEKAVEILNEEGIRVGNISEIFSGITPGTVLHQGPKAGCIANSLIPVDLVVSKAVVFELKTVPRVTGLLFEGAVAILEREGVNIGKVSRIASRASPGMVLFQGPKSGTIANPIIPVDLVVSRGVIPEVKRVPHVIDMPFAKAIETLKKEGVNVGRVSEIASRASPGIVLVQGPGAGCIANPVIPVDLVVSKAPKIEVKKVPRVLGLPFKEAVDVLGREGVDVGRISEIASRVSPGIVLFQGPGAGCIANPIIPVDLVVSKEVVPEVKKVPRVVGMPFEEAVATLGSGGVDVGKVSRISSRISPGMVLFQSPKSGCIANPVIPVDLVVSQAPKIEVKKVPQVIGLPFEGAVETLTGKGVKVGKISEISSRFSPGTVLHQGPRAGCIANPVIPVDLVVSKQPPVPEPSPVQKPEVPLEVPISSKTEVKEVPLVVNMHLDEATEVLKREGFNVGNILETASRFSPGTVLSQNPKNGCFAGQELPVDLVVSKKRSRLTLRRLARLRR